MWFGAQVTGFNKLSPEWVQALALLLATVAAVVTFGIKEIHLPRRAPATLTIQPSLEVIGRHGNDVLVRATFLVQNRNSRKIYVPLAWYKVYGYCYGARDIPVASFVEISRSSDSLPQAASRFTAQAKGEIVATGRVFSNVQWFDPDSERRIEELFLVPANRFSALQMNLDYFLTRTEEGLAKPEWKIQDDGALHGRPFLKREPNARDTTTSVPYDRDKHQKWKTRAGAAWGFSHASASLWPVAVSERGAPAGSAARCTPSAAPPALSAPAGAASAQIAARR